MKNLYSRLKPETKIKIDKRSENLPITQEIVVATLKEKSNWLDLTILECDHITSIVEGRMFSSMGQISTLFN